MQSDKRVIAALDDMTLQQAFEMTGKVKGLVAGVKVGFELLCDEGAHAIMDGLRDMGVPVFFDPKLHDIPSTAEKAARKLVRHGAWIINLHCSGGIKMMMAVKKGVDEETTKLALTMKPLVIGVTVLTSLDYLALAEIGFINRVGESLACHSNEKVNEEKEVRELALQMARLAQSCGLDGVVTSPREASAIRLACGPNFQIITPGIRLADGKTDDQVRIATPAGAIEAGADWLVIGRPVTQAEDPRATLELINQQVAEALAKKEGAVTA